MVRIQKQLVVEQDVEFGYGKVIQKRTVDGTIVEREYDKIHAGSIPAKNPIGSETDVQTELDSKLDLVGGDLIYAKINGDPFKVFAVADAGSNTHAVNRLQMENRIDSHESNVSNPHSVTKLQIGLGNVDNTADVDKPVSDVTQLALDDKAPLSHTTDLANPHAVTAVQVGADPDGSADAVQTNLDTHIADTDTHGLTTVGDGTNYLSDDGTYKNISPITVHNQLTGRDGNDTHPIESITGLRTEIDDKMDGDATFVTADFIVVSNGAEHAGKPIILDGAGQIDASLMGQGLYFVAMYIPDAANEYPDDTGESTGAFWGVEGVDAVNGYTFVGGDLTGETVFNGDMVVRGEQEWGYRNFGNVAGLYLRLDGSNSMSGNLPMGTNKIVNMLPATANGEAVEYSQLTAHVDNVANPHAVTASQIGALPTTGGDINGGLGVSKYFTISNYDGTADEAQFFFRDEVLNLTGRDTAGASCSVTLHVGGFVTSYESPTAPEHLTRKDYVDSLLTKVATVDDLASIPSPVNDNVVIVTDLARGGTFIYRSGAIDDGGIVFAGWVRQYDGFTLNAHWFNIIGDGLEDDTANIQKGIDASAEGKGTLSFPPGAYGITSELRMKNNARLMGVGVASSSYLTAPDQDWYPDQHSYFVYIGDSSDVNTCMLNLSRYDVGIEPDPDGTQYNLQNVSVINLGFDGNFNIDIGAYVVRARGIYKQIAVRKTRKHGFWFSHTAQVTFERLSAINNNGYGMSLGFNIFGWTRTWTDECVFVQPYTFKNGLTQTFDPNTENGRMVGYGFGIHECRGITVQGIETAKNIGAGIYVQNTSDTVTFSGGYIEFNTYDHSIHYDVIIEALHYTAFNHRFEGIRFGHSVLIRGGVEVSRKSASYIFTNCDILGGIVDSDIRTFQLINCSGGSPKISFPSLYPHELLGVYGNTERIGVLGAFSFDASAGNIDLLEVVGDIISVVYDGVGEYTVTYSGDGVSKCIAVANGKPNRWIHAKQSSTVNSTILIQYFSSDGVTLTDSGSIISGTIVQLA